MPEIMIAMILISLLPTTNNIHNDYQGKRTATLAVPKGKDFIFQVLQVYELKKKLLIPLNILLPLMMMLMVLFMTQTKKVGHDVDGDVPLPQVIARENKGAGIGEMFRTFLVEIVTVHAGPSDILYYKDTSMTSKAF